jgi:hypothetical protein
MYHTALHDGKQTGLPFWIGPCRSNDSINVISSGETKVCGEEKEEVQMGKSSAYRHMMHE